MEPHAEMVHWFFASGILFVGACLLCEAIVGREVWQMRRWRKYLWPGTSFLMGVLLWPVMAFYTNSAIHMYAHGSWAESLMLAGGAELGLVHGRLKSRWWRLAWPLSFVVTDVDNAFSQLPVLERYGRFRLLDARALEVDFGILPDVKLRSSPGQALSIISGAGTSR